MDQFVTHAGHLTQGERRILLPDLFRDALARLTDHFQGSYDCIDGPVNPGKLLKRHASGEYIDLVGGIKDIIQIIEGASRGLHMYKTSLRIRRPIWGLRALFSTRSTFLPRISDRCRPTPRET
ncbi:hypothetical protein ASZ90_010837 [hydrocarbon metagenome]|uniref:Uncharacterized protein n=1 Tax=hydrocarbon metagenome TaxID=938273 RepID=A0A0W8FF16_9ZZZZ